MSATPAPASAMDRPAWRPVLTLLMRHPSLWWTAIRQVLAFAPQGWWRRRPFLPLPDRHYVAFRMETQYGGSGAPEPEQIIEYLHWCREMRAIARESH